MAAQVEKVASIGKFNKTTIVGMQWFKLGPCCFTHYSFKLVMTC